MSNSPSQLDEASLVDAFLPNAPQNPGESHPLPQKIVDLVARLEQGDNTWTIEEVFTTFRDASEEIMRPELDALMPAVGREIRARMKGMDAIGRISSSKTGGPKLMTTRSGRIVKRAIRTIPRGGLVVIIMDILQTGLKAREKNKLDRAIQRSRWVLASSYAKFTSVDKWRMAGPEAKDPFEALTARFGAFGIGDEPTPSQSARSIETNRAMEAVADELKDDPDARGRDEELALAEGSNAS